MKMITVVTAAARQARIYNGFELAAFILLGMLAVAAERTLPALLAAGGGIVCLLHRQRYDGILRRERAE